MAAPPLYFRTFYNFHLLKAESQLGRGGRCIETFKSKRQIFCRNLVQWASPKLDRVKTLFIIKVFWGCFPGKTKTTHENILLFWLTVLIEWKQFLGGLLFISIVDFQGRFAKFSQNRYHSSKQNVTIVNSFYLNCLSLSHSHHKNVQPPPKETCINNPNYSARVPKSYLSFFPLSDKKHSLAKLFNPYHGKPSAFRPRPGSK